MLIKNERIAGVQEGDLTREQLIQLNSTFAQTNEDYPIVKGHIGAMLSGEPAWGWVKAGTMAFDGQWLTADLDLHEELGELIKEGKFANKSIGIYFDEDAVQWKFHHLAILGAEPPRIKGLKKIELSEEIKNVKNFSLPLQGEEEPNKKELQKMDEIEKLKKELEKERAEKENYSKKISEFMEKEKQFKLEKFDRQVDEIKTAAQGKVPKDLYTKFCETVKKEKENLAENEKVNQLLGDVKEMFSKMPKMVDPEKIKTENHSDDEPTEKKELSARDFFSPKNK